MKKILTLLLLALSLTICTISMADTPKHGSLAAHEHGKLSVNVAFIDNQLEIELEGPAASITGFEYVPSSEAEQKIVNAAKQTLQTPQLLFNIASAAQCTLTNQEISGAVFMANSQVTHDHDKHSSNTAHQHSEVEVHYAFNCKAGKLLTILDFSQFFKAFPLTRQINLQFINATGQQGAILTTTQPVFNLAK